MLMPDPIEIRKPIIDPPYGWTSRFQASLTDTSVNLKVRIYLKSDERIPLRDILKVRAETNAAVDRYFNQRFELIDPNSHPRMLMVTPEFVSDHPDLSVQLHPGNGRGNLNHWFVEAQFIIRAHEVGHALGLPDEYIDLTSRHRRTPEAPGIFRDNSLMGNFFKEGIEQAELKPRHGELLAKQLSESIGIPFRFRAQARVAPGSPYVLPTGRDTWAEAHAEARSQPLGTKVLPRV
jgi:hypothetical protein